MLLALAAVAVACGPAHATTLAQDAHARVYVQAGAVVACHRDRRYPLGSAARVLSVTVSGRFAAVQRRERRGQSLRVYDLRRGRPRPSISGAKRAFEGEFVTIRLARTGVAVYIARSLDGALHVSDTDDGLEYSGFRDTLDPSFLRLAGSTVAWREAGVLQLSAINTATPPGTLVRVGAIRLEVRAGLLRAAVRGGRAYTLGPRRSTCESPSSCSGIDRVDVAGHSVATHAIDTASGGRPPELRVHDLDARRTREPCRGTIAAFVFSEPGRLACGERLAQGGLIRSEATVLDQGPGVDPGSLIRRGDRLVWLHDGVERSAPLSE